MSKRRRGFPSETHVKRGVRIVHGNKQLEEKLGRNDLCPCGSGRRFKQCCLRSGCFRRVEPAGLLSGNDNAAPATHGRDSRRWSQTARRLPAEQPQVGSTPTGVFLRVEGQGWRVKGTETVGQPDVAHSGLRYSCRSRGRLVLGAILRRSEEHSAPTRQ